MGPLLKIVISRPSFQVKADTKLYSATGNCYSPVMPVRNADKYSEETTIRLTGNYKGWANAGGPRTRKYERMGIE
ncbi:MAG: hypothetical protein ACLQBD_19835 [Syntrophobacteraceae bacterium]